MAEPLTPCLFGPKHEPFYCRIHGDVRLSLTDERCRTAVRTAAAPPEGSIQCPMCGGSGWLVNITADAARAVAPVPAAGLRELRARINARTADWPQYERAKFLSLLDTEIALLDSLDAIGDFDEYARLSGGDSDGGTCS